MRAPDDGGERGDFREVSGVDAFNGDVHGN